MRIHTIIVLLTCSFSLHAAEEKNGIVTIEAESFSNQTLNEKRSWHITSKSTKPGPKPDGDPAHIEGSSSGAYIEILPDTRRSHEDKLIQGENFTNTAGMMAVLTYPVTIKNPGRYYVWVRTFSTNSEDNGLHFGLNGQWPESGARWQTVKKHVWNWDCKQRTEKVHIGVPMQLWLDIDKAGDHELLMSMREDGTEVDQIILAKSPDFRPPGLKTKKPEVALVAPRQPDGSGKTTVKGELKQWHKVTLALDGPFAHEQDNAPNPFTDLALNVTFTHESGSPKYIVPGYFATDGNAGESGAESGTQWLAHLSPDKTGSWKYEISFTTGKNAALDGGGEALVPFHGLKGDFEIAPSDKTGRDFRSKGRLQYVGKHHLQFAGTKEYFLKAGPDAPETLLGSADFDNTIAGKPGKVVLKTWQPHLQDWKTGDPTWKNGKGKGLIGALNYLAGKGVNAFSFLTYNAGGDGDNVWPFVNRDDKFNYDCSKLDQWGIVFDHATELGLYLHFKMQETEMDDNRHGHGGKKGKITTSLDGGALGNERKLYCRELIARFGHALAMNWNIGEENTQTADEVREMLQYIADTDPYQHLRVVHTFPNQQDERYPPLIGDQSLLTGTSLQNGWNAVHRRTLKWLQESAKAGKPWVVANDEQNPAKLGVPQDIGYKGTDGIALEVSKKTENTTTGDVKSRAYTMHDIRKNTLWGNLMAGGAGVEYYFGYSLPENDLVCQDWRSRDKSWDYCRVALDFFRDEKIPFQEMANADALIGNDLNDNSRYCFAKPGEIYLVYLPTGGEATLNLERVSGNFEMFWMNPRDGSKTLPATIHADSKANITAPDKDDWLACIRKVDA